MCVPEKVENVKEDSVWQTDIVGTFKKIKRNYDHELEIILLEKNIVFWREKKLRVINIWKLMIGALYKPSRKSRFPFYLSKTPQVLPFFVKNMIYHLTKNKIPVRYFSSRPGSWRASIEDWNRIWRMNRRIEPCFFGTLCSIECSIVGVRSVRRVLSAPHGKVKAKRKGC